MALAPLLDFGLQSSDAPGQLRQKRQPIRLSVRIMRGRCALLRVRLRLL
jgi:hypothetical protein